MLQILSLLLIQKELYGSNHNQNKNIIEMNSISRFLNPKIVINLLFVSIIFDLFMTRMETGLAAVTLIDFTVTYEENQVKLNWNTATEPDNALFFIERRDAESGNFTRISIFNPENNTESNFILPKGDSVSGGSYTVYDKHLINGVVYSYRLVAVDLNNNLEYITPTSVYNPPHTSTPTATVKRTTSTPRKTKSPSNTATNTPLPPTATYHPISPTVNPQPANLTPTPTALSNTPTPSQAVIVIPTLGLPSVTIIFPTEPASQTSYPSASVVSTPSNNSGWFTPRRITVIGLIISIWVILAGGFFIVLKKIE